MEERSAEDRGKEDGVALSDRAFRFPRAVHLEATPPISRTQPSLSNTQIFRQIVRLVSSRDHIGAYTGSPILHQQHHSASNKSTPTELTLPTGFRPMHVPTSASTRLTYRQGAQVHPSHERVSS